MRTPVEPTKFNYCWLVIKIWQAHETAIEIKVEFGDKHLSSLTGTTWRGQKETLLTTRKGTSSQLGKKSSGTAAEITSGPIKLFYNTIKPETEIPSLQTL